jgi:transcription initiation factor TFIID subunit 1
MIVMKKRKDLSAREGDIVLCEYAEEYPPILGIVGMGSRIQNYYRKESRNDTPDLNVRSFVLHFDTMSPFSHELL